MAQKSFVQWRNTFLAAIVVACAFIILAFYLAAPINLTAVDIGRHIKNGELILGGQRDLLYRNFYSFTHPDYPFINHHWLFGVLSFLIFNSFGFNGLSVAYIAVLLLGLFFFLRAGLLRGHFALVVLMTYLALPLLWDRREIRPEGISILLMGLYFYLLTKLSLGQMKRGVVFILIGLLQVIWVNTHIFFFMGPLLIGLFLWEGASRGCSVCVRNLRPLLVLSLLLNVVNPSGMAGALTPLNIFKGFGYRLAENQNVFFMMKFFPDQRIYTYFLLLAGLLVLGIALAIKRRGLKTNMAFIVLAGFVIFAGIKAVRLIQPFGYFFIPLSSFFYGQWEGAYSQSKQNLFRRIALSAAIILAGIYAHDLKDQPKGIGLVPLVNASAEFFKNNRLQGPVFSNYDIGGYLIFHLIPQEKVFVDNRQEAFPPDFFKNVYVPMQEDKKTWQKIDAQYQFNAIYFYRHDLTSWGQDFLIRTVDDPQWAPVFVDGFTIIFLKRNAQNQALIKRFELPRSMFGVKRH